MSLSLLSWTWPATSAGHGWKLIFFTPVLISSIDLAIILNFTWKRTRLSWKLIFFPHFIDLLKIDLAFHLTWLDLIPHVFFKLDMRQFQARSCRPSRLKSFDTLFFLLATKMAWFFFQLAKPLILNWFFSLLIYSLKKNILVPRIYE